jgi:hypothetical protein
MDRKEYEDMMEQRKMKKGETAVEGEGEKGGVEEEVVDVLDQHDHEHDHHHSHNHEGEEKKDNVGGAAAKEAAVVVPKKPLNGYMRYVAEIREAVTAEFLGLTGKELVSLLVLFVVVVHL